jgi:hypothetical protein
MSNITLITPPDKINTLEDSILLIYPSKIVKEQFQQTIAEINTSSLHVYLYEKTPEDHNIEWLMDIFHRSTLVLLDIDNCPSKIRDLTSYFIAKDKTFWLTNSGENFYNVISSNRTFNLDFIKNKIGESIEEE